MLESPIERKICLVYCAANLRLYDCVKTLITASPHLVMYDRNAVNLFNTMFRATMSHDSLTLREEVDFLELLNIINSLNFLRIKISDFLDLSALDHPALHLFLLAGFEFKNPEITKVREELIQLGSAFSHHELTNDELELKLLFSNFGLIQEALLDGSKICDFKKQFVMRLAENSETEREYRLF
jgi:hypothetical protein